MITVQTHEPREHVASGGTVGEPVDILSPEALKFLERLEHEFGERRKELLRRRVSRQMELNTGRLPEFDPATRQIRSGYWKVKTSPPVLEDRRVEIIGAPDASTIGQCLNSDANVFIADLEDSMTPTWGNVLAAQRTLYDAVRLSPVWTEGHVDTPAAKDSVELTICPRGLQADEKHVTVDASPISASLFDAGLFAFHNAAVLQSQGKPVHLYLPKIEGTREARFWNDVIHMMSDELHLPAGTIKVTVMIESIFAAFEMHEIIHELRESCIGLSCGWWNYVFNFVKKFRHHRDFVLPEMSRISSVSHFLHSLAVLLIQTCHKRGVHAIAGPSYENPVDLQDNVNKAMLIKVRVDAEAHAEEGFDGITVMHPLAVSVARSVFDKREYDPHQLHRKRDDTEVLAEDLLPVLYGEVTEPGARASIGAALEYLASWISGRGVVRRRDSFITAALAETARSQLWQWVHNNRLKYSGRQVVTDEFYRRAVSEELKKLISFEQRKDAVPNYSTAKIILDLLVLNPNFTDFFTQEAYQHID